MAHKVPLFSCIFAARAGMIRTTGFRPRPKSDTLNRRWNTCANLHGKTGQIQEKILNYCHLNTARYFSSSYYGNKSDLRASCFCKMIPSRQFRFFPHNSSSPKNKTIEQYLASRKIPHKSGYTSIMLPCTFCGVKESDKTSKIDLEAASEQWSLFVNKTTGRFICKNCGQSGAWNDLKVKMDLIVWPTVRLVAIS